MPAGQGNEGRKRYVELARKGFRTISKVSRWSWRILRAANRSFNFWTTVIRQVDNQVVQDLLSTFFGG